MTGMICRVGAMLLALAIQAPPDAAGPSADREPLDPSGPRVDRAQLMRDVRTLSSVEFEGRRTGSLASRRVQGWLVDQFRATRLTPPDADSFLQPFVIDSAATGTFTTTDRSGNSRLTAANVLGRLPGRSRSAKSIVLLAHYDHLGIRDTVLYPGADDNASGVAVLLAAARFFAGHPPRHPILFAALDAEEVGLRGARALIGSALLPSGTVAVAINMDMVSKNPRNEIFAAGTYHTPSLRPILEDVQRRSFVTIRFGHDRPERLGGGLEDWTLSSDHGPFHEAGIPFIYFGVEDHGDYHTPGDTAARIDQRFFGDTADMIVDAVRTLDGRLN
jgi:Zn-dependent M28 family amino/carboxypeptidase